MSVRPLSLLSAPLALAFAFGVGERPVLAQTAPSPVGAPVPGAAPTPVGATPTPFGAPLPPAAVPSPPPASAPVGVTPSVRPTAPIGLGQTTGVRPAGPTSVPAGAARPADARAAAAADA
ncbi:MAG: hypothetical protein MUF34_10690, partial [Polyangiaceae bacterium]|nr:hypothetical protein [Polyangiaceae bacterium]